MKALFAKVGKTLVPTDEEAEALLAKLPQGKAVMVGWHVPRSPQQHRLFWALMRICADNVDWLTDKDHAAREIKLACHLYEAHVSHDGKLVYVPMSIAWESLDQDKFNPFFERALRVICEKWIPGMDKEDLRREVEAMVGPVEKRKRK